MDVNYCQLNLNDGKTDPKGRLWFGSMDNLERKVEHGSLYCLEKNFELTKVDSNYMITNGPAFIDEKNFYHTDSRKKTIYKIKIDNNKIASKCRWTPFHGKEIKGFPVITIVNGEIKMKNGEIMGKPGGKPLKF